MHPVAALFQTVFESLNICSPTAALIPTSASAVAFVKKLPHVG